MPAVSPFSISYTPVERSPSHFDASQQTSTIKATAGTDNFSSTVAYYRKPISSTLTFPNMDIRLVLVMLLSTVTTVAANACNSANFYFRAPLEDGQSGMYTLTQEFLSEEKCQWIIDALNSSLCNITRVSGIGNPVIGTSLAKMCHFAGMQGTFALSGDKMTLSVVNQTRTEITQQLQCLIDSIKSNVCAPELGDKIVAYIVIILSIVCALFFVGTVMLYCARKIKRGVELGHDSYQKYREQQQRRTIEQELVVEFSATRSIPGIADTIYHLADGQVVPNTPEAKDSSNDNHEPALDAV